MAWPVILHSSFCILHSCRGGFARFFCIHHSPFRILHSPQGTLDILWTSPIPIDPPQKRIFNQASLSKSISCGLLGYTGPAESPDTFTFSPERHVEVDGKAADGCRWDT